MRSGDLTKYGVQLDEENTVELYSNRCLSAFQAVDPAPNPGGRTACFFWATEEESCELFRQVFA